MVSGQPPGTVADKLPSEALARTSFGKAVSSARGKVGTKMVTLFTYCIPYDDGAAPNPFWGVCTLVICKPKIRLVAQVGDWVVGTGSAHSPIGDISGKAVYAMRVTRKLEMWEYDRWTRESCADKIPEWHHADYRRRLGDSIYDFSKDPPKQRPGVHNQGNYEKDLSGKFALLSRHFFYFGEHPEPLPHDLLAIVKQGQGHRSGANEPYVERFVEWIHALGIKPNSLMGKPQLDLFEDESCAATCATARAEEDEEGSGWE